MRLCLVSMPWLATDTPSLAMGLLRRRVATECPSVEVFDYHGTLRWSEYLLIQSGGEVIPTHCAVIGDHGLAHGLGDWVFAGDLYDQPDWRRTELRARSRRFEFPLALAEVMRTMAGGFVAAAVDEILADQPDVVAFTTTFMQTVASLAVARRIKQARPQTRIVFGGANCDSAMGPAIHRNHPFVDFVVRGEGEAAFPALLDRIAAGVPPRDIAGVCWWDGEVPVANPEAQHMLPPSAYAVPDYDDWFETLETSPVREYLSPFLFVEGSRGCWWGERHHCTFCGLNDLSIGFRAKPAERFWTELQHLVRRHQVLDIMTTDNIMDVAYYRDLLPRLKSSGWDLRLQFEAKANVTAEQIAALSAAGVCSVQYGIESLGSTTLKLMDKGVTGTTNVRVLRDSEAQHITVGWNYLYGFPGETESDYRPVIAQLPALVHLQPPVSATRIALQRFSPYFERPELGFPRRTPADFYFHVYDLPEAELADLAYFFDTDDRGIGGKVEHDLIAAVTAWRRDYPVSSLFWTVNGEDLTVHDRRAGWPVRDHVLSGWQRAAYEGLDRGRTPESLRRHLGGIGWEVSADAVEQWLTAALANGLLYTDAGSYVALATSDVAVHFDATARESVAA